MADGTQFSDLPSCLAIDILLRLPLKTLSICRYVRKEWTRLYFSDPYFIRRQLETSNIQFLEKDIKSERKFRFGCIVDEVSTGNLRIESLDLSCKFLPDPKQEWWVVNSCNGLVCLIDEPYDYYGTPDNSIVYVCNPVLGEWVSIPVPSRCYCALGFSAKSNQYKILLCIAIGDKYTPKYEWEIYTLGTEHWRSIETKENTRPWNSRLGFNTFIHGSLHWTRPYCKVEAFDFETERFTTFSSPHFVGRMVRYWDVILGVINGCLWASLNDESISEEVQMWAMKEYGDDKSWTMMLALRDDDTVYDPPDEVLKARYKELVIYKDDIWDYNLLFTLNGEEVMLICDYYIGIICYNIKGPMRRRVLTHQYTDRVTAYTPSFVSLHDYGRGEQVIRGRDLYLRRINEEVSGSCQETKEQEEETQEEDQ